MRLLLLSLFTSFICAPSAFAQLEVGTAGTISIGNLSPNTTRQLYLKKDAENAVGYHYGIFAISESGGAGSFGVLGEGIDGQGAVGLRGKASGGTDFSAGVYGTAVGEAESIPGVAAKAYSFYGNTTGAATFSYGLYALDSSTGGTSYGVYARSSDHSANSYGIYAKGNTYAGFFSGDVHSTGTITPSDTRFKEDVVALGQRDVRTRLMQLSPKQYRIRETAETERLRMNGREEYGLIAQELEAVFPELVHEVRAPAEVDPETGEEVAPAMVYKGVNYQGLIPLLLQVVQEQDAELVRLRQALEKAGITVE